ncbi:type 1 fimbrial protein [Providencia rettgeri]|uniref:Fimbrial protein n=3 Tax=Gammaproteobacteria TaxID=1236 RepID=A0AA42FH71_9GAMM|nr:MULTISPECIES: fimbrial protein [Providencia]MBC8652381.1 type 1 fimbrial protein [Providencia vermicola]HCI97493.1 type 1 fimbrial protein [Providencia sp.]APC13668.1 Major MR/P fimbria protein precursor [Providencia rettgeri]AVL73023.1 type 1 fimbrial protein [Providencia rettgeri]EIL1984828.1 type 1 fimbrial protein [Providencia rettgeri]
MKKLVIATMVFGAMSASALAVDAGTGKVHFSGSIITAPCSIAPGDENQEVPLGQISNTTLESGGMSSAQPFAIKLEGCTLNAKYKGTNEDGEEVELTYNNTVNVKFTGTEWVNSGNNTGLIQITGDGQGAGVKLMTVSGNKIDLNSSTTQNFVAGDNSLRFQAALQGVSGAQVNPGKFEATTNFVLSYN